jgi:hypothetical protein
MTGRGFTGVLPSPSLSGRAATGGTTLRDVSATTTAEKARATVHVFFLARRKRERLEGLGQAKKDAWGPPGALMGT